MKIYRIIGCVVFLFLAALNAQQSPDSLLLQIREEMHQAIHQWSEKGLQETRSKFERLLTLSEKDWLVHYYIAYTDYNLTLNYMSQNKESEAEKILDDAIEHLNKSIELNENFAGSFALLSTCYGMKISFSPMKSVYLGPRSGVALSKARALEADNPRVHLIEGINSYHTPSMFGGGKDNARKALKKSAELFETYKPESSLYPDWGHEGPYIWLGRIALEQDSLDLAEQYFDQALQINPDHGQVKHQLLPQLQKKRQEQSAAKNKTSE